jgi:glyoxylase-like metal-dependent hydrolase (beta-lactamase superfamily II)
MPESAPRPFASSADTEEKVATLDEIADGVYAYTAEGDPNVGAIVGPDSIVMIDSRATPVAAQRFLDELRRVTDKPVSHLVLTHYHAVRVLGAAALAPCEIIAGEATRALIAERGAQDWESEYRRMPRLFEDPESIPGLTWPTITFADELSIWLGDREVQLRFAGRGHTAGDIVVWLPDERVLFAGDLVEAEAALYMGDSYSGEWGSTTLDNVAAFHAAALVPGRGGVARGEAVDAAIEQTRTFIHEIRDVVARARENGDDLKAAFDAVQEKLTPKYRDWPIYQHVLPFNVKRIADELAGREPAIWTAETDAAIWDELQR